MPRCAFRYEALPDAPCPKCRSRLAGLFLLLGAAIAAVSWVPGSAARSLSVPLAVAALLDVGVGVGLVSRRRWAHAVALARVLLGLALLVGLSRASADPVTFGLQLFSAGGALILSFAYEPPRLPRLSSKSLALVQQATVLVLSQDSSGSGFVVHREAGRGMRRAVPSSPRSLRSWPPTLPEAAPGRTRLTGRADHSAASASPFSPVADASRPPPAHPREAVVRTPFPPLRRAATVHHCPEARAHAA